MPSGADVNEPRIRELLARGDTVKQIAERLAVSRAVVNAIKAGRRHVKEKANG